MPKILPSNQSSKRHILAFIFMAFLVSFSYKFTVTAQKSQKSQILPNSQKLESLRNLQDLRVLKNSENSPTAVCKLGENSGKDKNICCNEIFEPITKKLEENCVYKEGQFKENGVKFCKDNGEKCYYCCQNRRCRNKLNCESHFEDSSQNALFIFSFIGCLFLLAAITYSLLFAIRLLRLSRLTELKQSHQYLSNASLSEGGQSGRESERESRSYRGGRRGGSGRGSADKGDYVIHQEG